MTKEQLDDFVVTESDYDWEIAGMKGELEDLLRLARLGLWAEKYGIEAVKLGLENTNSDFCSHVYKDGVRNKTCSWCEPFEKALAALPGTDLAPPK